MQMERFTTVSQLTAALVIVYLLLVRPVHCQTSTLCTGSMMRSFSSCMNFVTNGSGSSPTADCCDSLKSLMSSGRDCLCLFITGGIPFSVPINRTLAASLPRACKRDGVPIECKAMGGAPIPAPGPTDDDRQPPPWLPEPNTPTLTPPENGGDGTLTPPGLTPDDNGFPTMTPPGVRPDLSTAAPSQSVSHLLLLAICGAIAFTYS